MPPPRLSMVIVNWNAGSALTDCVRSARAASAEPLDVVVVDNASTDGSVEALRAADPEARVVANDANRGLAAANNQGILATATPLVLISNPDVVYDPNCIDELVAAAVRHPAAGFVVPRIRGVDGTLQTSAGDLPTLSEALLGRQVQRRRASCATTGFWWDGWAHDVEREIGRGHECAYIVRREALTAIGPQDERFVLDWEGIDWTARLREAGWAVWFAPAATAVHLGGVSLRQVRVRWVVRSHLGMYRYFAKRRPVLAPLLAPVVAARGGVKLLSLLAGGGYDRGVGTPGERAPTGQQARSRSAESGSPRDGC